MGAALYQQVYESLRDAIHDGTYPVGERLPGEAELTAEHHVSAITLKRALDLLRADGYIVRRPRLGTFVVSDVATAAPSSQAPIFPLIGCIVTDFDDTFGTRVLGGLLDGSATSANLIMKRTRGDLDAENEHVRNLIESGVRGLIVQPSSSEYMPPALLELVSRGFPVVILDRSYGGVPVTTVCSDNVAAAKEATEHLISRGHSHIGLITSASHVSTIDDRRTGFMQAHAEFHVPQNHANEFRLVRSTIPGSVVPAQADIDALTGFLSAHPDLTGFVVTEYSIAVLLRRACEELGLSVPRDISIVCFDHPQSLYRDEAFQFTHVLQNQDALGMAAVECVLAQLREPLDVRKVTVPTTLVEGDSVAAPAKH